MTWSSSSGQELAIISPAHPYGDKRLADLPARNIRALWEQPRSLEAALRPPQTKKLTQATRALLDGKRNPEMLKTRTVGAWLLTRTAQLSPQQHLCSPHTASSHFGDRHAAQRVPGRQRGQGTHVPHIPQHHRQSPAEILSETLPSTAGLSPRPELSGSPGSTPAGKKSTPAVKEQSLNFPKRQQESNRKGKAVCYPPSKCNFCLPIHHQAENLGSACHSGSRPSALKFRDPARHHCPRGCPAPSHGPGRKGG